MKEREHPTISPTGYWAGDTAYKHHEVSVPLSRWIVEYLKGDEQIPVHDFGCGMGNYLRALEMAGFKRLFGWEGEVPLHATVTCIQAADLTDYLYVNETGNVICLEVAEHIPPEFEEQFLDNVTAACAGHLIFSWAVRGQGGDGHVNCRDNEEAIELVTERGFEYLAEASKSARAVIDGDQVWFKNTLLIFKRAR